MNLTHKQAALLLTRLTNIGPRTAKKLLDQFPHPERLFTAPSDKLLKINGLGESHLQAIGRWKTLLPLLKKEEKEIKKQGLKVLTYGESTFTAGVANGPLFSIADADLNRLPVLRA